MIPAIRIGAIGFLLSTAPAWAGNIEAETDFVNRASIGNLFAIAESQLAIDRPGDARIKTFARGLVADHGKAEAALQAAAENSGVKVPSTLDQLHQARVRALRDKSGLAFDRAYVADQDEAHSNALTLYGDYMLLGDDRKLKALAIRMIPVTESQLKRAQALSPN